MKHVDGSQGLIVGSGWWCLIMVDYLVLECLLIMVNNEGNRLPYESEKPCIDSLLNEGV